MRATVEKAISFDAAHFLPDYAGKCSNMHGHHWVVKLGVEGEIDNSSGMVIDFTILGKFLKEVEDVFDHHLVNNIVDNPTAENIAIYIRNMYLGRDIDLGSRRGLKYIRVWETEDSMAEVGRE